jgi:hypothetical protein
MSDCLYDIRPLLSLRTIKIKQRKRAINVERPELFADGVAVWRNHQRGSPFQADCSSKELFSLKKFVQSNRRTSAIVFATLTVGVLVPFSMCV